MPFRSQPQPPAHRALLDRFALAEEIVRERQAIGLPPLTPDELEQAVAQRLRSQAQPQANIEIEDL